MTTETATLKLEHVASGDDFEFSNVGLRIFTESYNSEWNQESVFGKMDDILSYKSTKREISLEFICGSQITNDAGYTNAEIAEIIPMMLYPTYDDSTGANALSIKDPPLLRVYFEGFIQAKDNVGQLCAVTNFTLDRGTAYNDPTTTDKSSVIEAAKIVVQMSLIPLHEFTLGYTKDDDGNYSFGDDQSVGYYVSNTEIVNE